MGKEIPYVDTTDIRIYQEAVLSEIELDDPTLKSAIIHTPGPLQEIVNFYIVNNYFEDVEPADTADRLVKKLSERVVCDE